MAGTWGPRARQRRGNGPLARPPAPTAPIASRRRPRVIAPRERALAAWATRETAKSNFNPLAKR
eukprot:11117334-Lingulodinium_polyedra.AAC.1